MKKRLFSLFEQFQNRKTKRVEGDHFLEFLNEYAQMFKFEVPIDPTILLKQIHPDFGNLTRVKGDLSFN